MSPASFSSAAIGAQGPPSMANPPKANPPTIQDVLYAIRGVESRIDSRFSGVETRLGGIETSIADIAEQNKLFRDKTAEQLASLHAKVEECACRCPQSVCGGLKA